MSTLMLHPSNQPVISIPFLSVGEKAVKNQVALRIFSFQGPASNARDGVYHVLPQDQDVLSTQYGSLLTVGANNNSLRVR